MKKCPRCKINKDLIEFGSQSMCRECKTKYNKMWKENNPDYFKNKKITKQYKEQQREYRNARKVSEASRKAKWRKDNPDKHAGHERARRARMRNNIQEPYSEKQVLERYGKLCYLCNLEIDLLAPRRVGVVGWEVGLHIDHYIDIALGGSDTIENVRPTHGLCNLRKEANNG